MLSGFFQNFGKPKEGRLGRMLVRNMNQGHADLTEWGLSCADIAPDARILDIGCGGGGAIARMLRDYPASTVDGVDHSPQSVAVSRETNRDALGTRCAIRQGSVSALPYPDAAYDVVTAFETVYFWPDLPRDFAEVRRVVRPGGQFILCVEFDDPNDDTWTKRIDGMRIYDAQTLADLLREAGFTQIHPHKRRKHHLCVIAM